MSRTVSWVQQHRLTTFFVLAYVVAWAPWPLASAGLLPAEISFFPGGPLVSALVVIGIADGRPGFRDLGSRLVRWRVGWVWYVVAIGFPVLLVLVTGLVNSWLGAPAPDLAAVVWADVALMLAFRLVDVTDGAAGEEPGFRGFAVPHLQSRLSPLGTAGVLGILVAGWHLPLVVMGSLAPVGLPSTVAITFLYVWLFNRTGGSLLMTLLFHASQGAFTFGMLGFSGADADRAPTVYFVVLVVAVAAVIGFDGAAWRKAPASAVTEALVRRRPAAMGAGRTLILGRPAVAGAATVVLLAACGGGGDESAADSSAQTSAAETTVASGETDFCARAAGIDGRVDAALSDLEGDNPSVADAFRQIAEELRGIDAPAEISDDWDSMAAGLDRMADAVSDIDVTDLGTLEGLEDAEGDLSTATTNVDNYLRDECGIDP